MNLPDAIEGMVNPLGFFFLPTLKQSTMKTINKLITRTYSYSQILASGAMLFGFFPFPFLNPDKLLPPAPKADVKVAENTGFTTLADQFFGNGSADTDAIIQKQMDFVSSRGAYQASLAVIKKHEETIRKVAREKGVPEDVAIGVALLENGGSETAVSKAGALGVFQLMPGTARALGLTVNKKLDERKDPVKNINAGIDYLKMNYERFGDWGLATWAYHAGEGNVAKALQLYAKADTGTKLPGVKEAPVLRSYVTSNNITIHKLLSSSAVKTLTKKLSDDSAGYPYKVLATATLFKNSAHVSTIAPGVILGNR